MFSKHSSSVAALLLNVNELQSVTLRPELARPTFELYRSFELSDLRP